MSLSKLREARKELKKQEEKYRNTISFNSTNLIPGHKAIREIPGVGQIFNQARFNVSTDGKDFTLNSEFGMFGMNYDCKDKDTGFSITKINPLLPFIQEKFNYFEGKDATLTNSIGFGPFSFDSTKKYTMDDFYDTVGRMTGNPMTSLYGAAMEKLFEDNDLKQNQ